MDIISDPPYYVAVKITVDTLALNQELTEFTKRIQVLGR
jgi:hypothetical protein